MYVCIAPGGGNCGRRSPSQIIKLLSSSNASKLQNISTVTSSSTELHVDECEITATTGNHLPHIISTPKNTGSYENGRVDFQPSPVPDYVGCHSENQSISFATEMFGTHRISETNKDRSQAVS